MKQLLSMIIANKNDQNNKKANGNTNQKQFNMNNSSISNHNGNFRNRSWDPTVT